MVLSSKGEPRHLIISEESYLRTQPKMKLIIFLLLIVCLSPPSTEAVRRLRTARVLMNKGKDLKNRNTDDAPTSKLSLFAC